MKFLILWTDFALKIGSFQSYKIYCAKPWKNAWKNVSFSVFSINLKKEESDWMGEQFVNMQDEKNGIKNLYSARCKQHVLKTHLKMVWSWQRFQDIPLQLKVCDDRTNSKKKSAT